MLEDKSSERGNESGYNMCMYYFSSSWPFSSLIEPPVPLLVGAPVCLCSRVCLLHTYAHLHAPTYTHPQGVGVLVLDEFHERSLDADTALALALDCQAWTRPDLRYGGAGCWCVVGECCFVCVKGWAKGGWVREWEEELTWKGV